MPINTSAQEIHIDGELMLIGLKDNGLLAIDKFLMMDIISLQDTQVLMLLPALDIQPNFIQLHSNQDGSMDQFN